jgi:hypothetical protein
MDDIGTCKKCKRPLIEIDHYRRKAAIGGVGKEASASSWSCRKRTFRL